VVLPHPRLLLLLSALFALTACGFQLRQAAPLPAALAQVSVKQTNPLGLLGRQVERELRQAGAQLGGSNAALLQISSERFDRRVMAVNERARVSEYQLTLRVKFQVNDAQGKSLLAAEEFELLRDYSFDALAAIGAGQEEALIREEMTRDAARRIVVRASRGLN